MSNIAVEGLTFLLILGSIVFIVPLSDWAFRFIKKAEFKRKNRGKANE